MLTVKNLNNKVLKLISFTLKAGECLGVSGVSGAGKSCLLRALADLDSCQGQLALNATACLDTEPQIWRAKVAYLSAESAWWSDIVGDHFVSEATDYLVALALAPDIMQWAVDRLSTGERQRLALLRMLDRQPEVLLLDEPTASLDTDNIARVEALIAAYQRKQQAAVLWVSHSPEQLARVSDRQMIMAAGRLLETNLAA